MADHGTVEYATATGNDLAAHESTYEAFVHLAFVGTLTVVNIVIGLAIVGVTDHWGVALATMAISVIVGFRGLMSGARNPIAIMTLVSLLALAVTA
ncbi:MAG TPA: aa3-type cytochrome c oxidase subunit IV [Xanthobacteraceae bacterium]|jgi:amino acid transporter|nr:aa3-type cytochrome c oxidase subunit IV [Xanthobacteraceae bacterium]